MEGDTAFKLYSGCLKPIGVWPLEDGKSLFRTVRYTVAAIAMASLVLHTLMEIYLSNTPISGMADLILFCSSAFLALVKHTFLYVHRNKIAKNLRSCLNDWTDTKDASSLKIMRYQVKLYRYMFLVYYSIGYIGTTFFFLRTILYNELRKRQNETDENFEYTLVCQVSFLSKEIIAKYYALIMLIQYVQSMYTCTSGAGTDCFFLALVFHLCGQLKILKKKWRELKVDEALADAPGGPVQRKKVIELIDRHRELVDNGDRLEQSFHGMVLIQLLTSIVLICVSGFSVLVAIKNADHATVMVSTNCISFMIQETFIYGYTGDLLISESEEVAQAAYSADWYEVDPSIRKDFKFVMARAQIPLRITAGKFFSVTRNTVIQLLKMTFSFLSFMRITLEKSYEAEAF